MSRAARDHRRGATFALVGAAAVTWFAASAGASVRADFDDDGFGDLAIGIEGEDLPAPENVTNAGAVTVIYGSATGLDPEGPPADQFWHEEVDGVRGTGTGDDGFGTAVTAGDFDGDGRADLAVGAAGDRVDGEEYAGSVRVLYGAGNGLTATGDDLFTEATDGVPGGVAEDDDLGQTLAAGDFDGDGHDDVAATIGCQRVAGEECAGAVLVFYGGAAGLERQRTRLFNENTEGIAGTPSAFDEFGSALAAGDFDGKGGDDLAVGVPGDAVGLAGAAGTVRILFGTGNGLTAQGDRRIHADQGTISDFVEAGDRLGTSVASGRIDGGGAAELAIGVPNDNLATGGLVHVLHGSGGGPSVTQTETWAQSSAGILGTPAAGDRFGDSLAIGNFDGESRGDLAVGVPDDDDAGPANAGAVNVLYGDGDTITEAGDQLIHQAAVFVEGVSELNDQMGAALASGNFDSGEAADLAITVTSDTAGSVDDAGAVQVFYGSNPLGLDADTDILFHQGLAEIQNEPTESEFFGYSLAAGW